jgi:hypothetical protein
MEPKVRRPTVPPEAYDAPGYETSRKARLRFLLRDIDYSELPLTISRKEFIGILQQSRQLVNYLVGLCNNVLNSGDRRSLSSVDGLQQWFTEYCREYRRMYEDPRAAESGAPYFEDAPFAQQGGGMLDPALLGGRLKKEAAYLVDSILSKLTEAERTILIRYFSP